MSFHRAGIRVARLMLQDTAGCKRFQEILDKKVEGTRSVGQHSQTSSLPLAAHGCSLQGCSLQAPAQPPLCLYPGGPTGARRALREGRRSKKEQCWAGDEAAPSPKGEGPSSAWWQSPSTLQGAAGSRHHFVVSGSNANHWSESQGFSPLSWRPFIHSFFLFVISDNLKH